jgi:hypothetical protein
MRTLQDRTMLTPVVHMLRISVLAFCFAPAAFLASPLTADDLYGAPNPGWYNQGSGAYAPQPPARSGDDGYGSARYGDGQSAAGYPGGWQSGAGSYTQPGGGYDDWRAYRGPEPLAVQPDGRERISPNGYGAPDWAQEPILPEQDDHDERYGARQDPRDGYAPVQRSPWRAPQERPRYRFRDDPDLAPGVGDAGSELRFRPLSKKERARLRGPDDDARFADPYRDRDYRPRRDDATDDRGTAFGYEPAPYADDFYQRYYRSGR